MKYIYTNIQKHGKCGNKDMANVATKIWQIRQQKYGKCGNKDKNNTSVLVDIPLLKKITNTAKYFTVSSGFKIPVKFYERLLI